MDDEILRYVEPVYRFCLKRVSSHADAEDLAQEILLCILQGRRRAAIANLDGYVWRVAHNRYARRIDAQNRDVTVLCGDEYLMGIPQEAAEEADEGYEAVFRALHTLSRMYRDILVEFYVRNLEVHTIAERHNLSIDTVKWRLHVGRERIRERVALMDRMYEGIRMYVMCNGSFDPRQYLGTQLYKAIAKACYEAPRTIEEISLATGVPTLYLEEALEHMIWGDAIEKNGQKYATAFIITRSQQRDKLRRLLTASVVGEVTDALWGYIHSTEGSLRQIGFYGADFPLPHLLYVVVPAILYAVAERMRKSIPALPTQRPPRKDGGNGWFIVHEGVDRLDEYDAGCNGYRYDANGGQPGEFLYYWIGDTFSGSLNDTLRNARFFLNAVGGDGACTFGEETDAAKAFANGLCENRGGRIYSSIPVFTKKQYTDFSEWVGACSAIDSLWQKWIDALFSAYRSFTPRRLEEQIGGNVDGYSFNLSAFVLKELRNRGAADQPREGKTFMKNLLLIRG
jgi:RNA polymerase sigma factor, sigma-70 family